MAKRTTFKGSKPKKLAETSFAFGANAMSKRQRGEYRKGARKGGSGGGS